MTTAQNVLTIAKTFVGLQEVGGEHVTFALSRNTQIS